MNHQQLFFCRATGLALGLASVLSAAAVMPSWAAGDLDAKATLIAQAATAEMIDGEVRKVDKEGGKLTLKHADIKSLDMPAMTMVFVVKDKAMLDKLKAGDKIKFKAINDAGKFTVTEMQMAQ
jgi:Cu(I)/Ag(I) efflux system protein CusF